MSCEYCNDTAILPMTAEDADWRSRFQRNVPPGTMLFVKRGLHEGRHAEMLRWHERNPWLLHVRMDGVDRTVRFDYTELA